jgi:hypothetical protein
MRGGYRVWSRRVLIYSNCEAFVESMGFFWRERDPGAGVGVYS